MKSNNMCYPLLLLACIQVSVVIAKFDNRRTIVADGYANDETHVQRKVKGRHRQDIATLLNSKNSQDKMQPAISAEKGTEEHHSNKSSTSKENIGLETEDIYPKGGAVDTMDVKTVFFILIGITSFFIGYFVFRIIRSKSSRKTKKYGVLATHGSEVELTPLEQDDEDEDMTVFDANST